ncbi:hypothetical protein A3D06_00385 [Candidatus Roizmanbacteria bacterium RIFCSPHIGHO2_02_FULL_40_9]|uniref:Uncharacterized protein n=2 Tax=Candidatus Roizmaniibacteriota TaxID=1752723 RepID=A0A1F7IL34_9BACT|nr:MAG: hypothetical protein A3D06_00385 [Candidatus Roizmanbacteria bacterium RIFCSPHIGHO2_02_FULL_40_9]OGK44053.1 MAG: hypothetical protein A2957_01830 [Candidatus Roizmanbacteria bacterium RIFCSPLOWO2_01_FULL_38_11]
MKATLKLITYFVTNLIVLYLAMMFAGNFVVFGRLEILPFQALITTAFGLALAVTIVDLIVTDYNVKVPPERYIILEAIVNVAALYLLARTPIQNSVGIGIVAFWVAIVIGIVLSVVQFIAKQSIDAKRKMK